MQKKKESFEQPGKKIKSFMKRKIPSCSDFFKKIAILIDSKAMPMRHSNGENRSGSS